MSLPTGGLVAISVTPLTETGEIDFESLARLMHFYLDAGSSGVAILGVMGEANRMTDDEARDVVEASVEAVGGRVPVIVGVSDSSLERVRALAAFSQERGCAGVLLQPLAGIQGDAGVVRYFQAAAVALGPEVPICVQDFPKANGVHISVTAWRQIVATCPSVVMLKAEDEPGLGKLSAIRQAEAEGLRRVTILTGNNGIHLVQELARGADGAMTGFAFPDVLSRVIAEFQAGEAESAEDLFDQYLPVNRHELRMGIAVRKEILRRRGAIATAVARFPASGLDEVDQAELNALLARLERRTGLAVSELRTG